MSIATPTLPASSSKLIVFAHSRCGSVSPPSTKRMTLWTSTPWLMPLFDQMFAVTASQSSRKNVNEPWSWWACDWSYLPATIASHAASVVPARAREEARRRLERVDQVAGASSVGAVGQQVARKLKRSVIASG